MFSKELFLMLIFLCTSEKPQTIPKQFSFASITSYARPPSCFRLPWLPMIPQQARSPLLNWYWTKVSPHNLLRDGLPSVYLKPKLLYRGPGILWTSFIYLEVRVPVCSLLHSPQVLVPFLIVRAGASGRFLWLSQLILVPAQITLKVWLSLLEEVIFPFRLVEFVYF